MPVQCKMYFLLHHTLYSIYVRVLHVVRVLLGKEGVTCLCRRSQVFSLQVPKPVIYILRPDLAFYARDFFKIANCHVISKIWPYAVLCGSMIRIHLIINVCLHR